MTRTPDAAPARWRARVYGMVVAGGQPVRGLEAMSGAIAPDVELVELTAADLDAAWPARGSRIVSDRRGGGPGRMTIAEHPQAGWRMDGEGRGAALVARDGARVLYAAVGNQRPGWERYLLAQVLPFTAGVRGIEQLHAACVVVAGRGVAVAGPSGAGKTTVARALLERGAEFLADDVVAVTDEPEGLRAHPGPGLMSVRGAGADDASQMVALGVRQDPVPLAMVCLLERGPTRPPLSVEPVDNDARPLLAAAYNLVLRDPERLVTQLDLCAKIMRVAEVSRIRAAPETPAEDIAEAIVALAARPRSAR